MAPTHIFTTELNYLWLTILIDGTQKLVIKNDSPERGDAKPLMGVGIYL
jgi:hypothetical protein